MNETHPEPAEIAALDEDLLEPAEAAAVRDHLARCASCGEVQADLAALRDELARLPDPGPVPDDIALRIDAALAAVAADDAVSRETAEALAEKTAGSKDAAGADAAGARHRAPVAGPRWMRVLRLGLAAAGAIVVLGMGAVMVQSFGGGNSDSEGTADMNPEAGSGEAAEEPVETQVRELLAEAESTSPMVAGDSGGSAESHPPESTGEAEDAEGSETPESGGEPESGSGEPEPDATPAVEVPPCVEAAIGRVETPLAAGEEDYAGMDAYLVIFQHQVDPEQVDAYVVAATCVTASPSAEGEVLLQESYPRD
ncbi:hypothetical protein [Streptomyces sp. SBT349]|uniref:hypothetical protein n=1 Tax=Streptomyces sp. SBT349 TaxID=1580539 RepID=UPI00066D73D8|nr:hypothetical protein [Streptomyces sp. SBT349]